MPSTKKITFIATNIDTDLEELKIILRYASSLEEAQEIVQLLEDNQIPSTISKNSSNLDSLIVGEMPTNKFEIQIRELDKEKAENVLLVDAKESIATVDEEYFLFSFSNEELIDILMKEDEWNELDVALAEKILKERGAKIDYHLIETERNTRKEQQKQPDEIKYGWIILGYLMAIFGGFFGLIIGYGLWVAKKILPDGTKVPAYSTKVQQHGKAIFFIGAFTFITTLSYKFITWLASN